MKRGAFLLSCFAFLGALVASGGQAIAPPNHHVDPAQVNGPHFPKKLSEYRFFRDLRGQVPTTEVIPYELNVPLYSDGADKLRFMWTRESRATDEGLIDFAPGTALIKTFAFGEGEQRRLIETRLLLHRADGWVALPYRWNEEQTDATLALAGARIPIELESGETISYRIPNKNQCKECHGLDDEVVPLGPRARNMSRGFFEALQPYEWLLEGMPKGVDQFPVWSERDEANVETAARAYLDVNCAHCHRPGAMASNSGLDLRWEQDDPKKLGILKRPVAAGRGSGGHEFSIVPGNPENSIMVHRMASTEGGVAMPELGKATVDHEGLEVVRRWIAEMEQ